METQLAAQATPTYQTILLFVMDLERNALKLSLIHLVFQSLPSGTNFKTLDKSINVVDIPLLDKINFHGQAREILYSDLRKIYLIVTKVEKILDKV